MSTNKAFIDAYNTASRPKPLTTPAVSSGDTAVMFSASELVLADAFDMPYLSDEAADDSAPETAVATETSEPAESPAKRKPLSQVRAETLFGLRKDASHARGSSKPNWPLVCQQVLARSADKFDAVLRKLPNESPSTLVGLVGASSPSGCSTAAICLALRSSALGYNTLLLDGNLAKAGLAEQLEVTRYSSWIDKLLAGDKIESALLQGDVSGVDLLLAKPMIGGELEPNSRFRASLAAGVLRRKYHRVVIDFGAAVVPQSGLAADLAAALGVDYLLATAAPSTTEHDLAQAVVSLDQFGLKLAGVIEATV
ncbi:P-loop NTPase family protein [Aeoliella mucimassa]|uniref:Rhodanese domain-containing protein n=1 Tax=Aeoliella mucimassa TaxID=2527972 RepID=A0A518AI74_9BACT|nr:CpsD/CapB family tyrosine-protein kinase [Aeoliella mucimassa]QDU54429.1 hypothetical protein Pan181_06100 [Aeoliella mucimassa]